MQIMPSTDRNQPMITDQKIEGKRIVPTRFTIACIRVCAVSLTANAPDAHSLDSHDMLKSLALTHEPHSDPTTTAEQGLLIYLAGPYSQPDPVQNTHVVLKVADALLAAGFVPLVPHLSLAWHLVSPKPYAVWLAYDHELLKRCDAVLRIPGFSVGATQECRLAESLGIPIVRSRSTSPADCVAALVDYYSN